MTVDWVGVEGPGNACDAQPQGCFGAVAAAFRIARTEVTNAQYAEFLNAVAQADPNGLYNPSMASSGAATAASRAAAAREAMPTARSPAARICR